MDEQTIKQPESAPELALYEQLYQKLYAYHFGAIGFLELLDEFERILHLKTHSDQSSAA